MQTIENSLLQVSVDENGAGITHLIAKQNSSDYFEKAGQAGKMVITFPDDKKDKNLTTELPWTVVDKGDARVSLTMIDTPESYQIFPYHFEMMITYAVEGNQLHLTFSLKNNSNKVMPSMISMNLPMTAKVTDEDINRIVLAGKSYQATIESTDFHLKQNSDLITCTTDKTELAGETGQKFELSFTIE